MEDRKTVRPGRTHGHVIDAKLLGQSIKGTRHLAGYSRVVDLAQAIQDQYGIKIAPSTLHKYEQGRTVPPLETLIVLAAVIEPPGGLTGMIARSTRGDLGYKVFGGSSLD